MAKRSLAVQPPPHRGCRSLLRYFMVYISSWQEFQEAAESLYEKSPKNVREYYSMIHRDINALMVCIVDTLLREMESRGGKVGSENHRRCFSE